MKIAIIGATGMIGCRVVKELLDKRHTVTAIARRPGKMPDHPRLTRVAVDIFDFGQLGGAIAGHDALVCAFAPPGGNGPEAYKALVEAAWRIKRAFKQVIPDAYLLNIGGASSLWGPTGLQMFEDPAWPSWFFNTAPVSHFRHLNAMTGISEFAELGDSRERILGDPAMDPCADFPEPHLQAFLEHLARNHNKGEGGRAQLEFFVGDHSLRWSFASPPWFLREGVRTGQYRTTIDALPVEKGQPAPISVDDFALAVADVVDAQKFVHQHWSAARVESA